MRVGKCGTHAVTTDGREFILMLQICSRVNAPPNPPAEGMTIWGGPNYAVPLFGKVVSGLTHFVLGE